MRACAHYVVRVSFDSDSETCQYRVSMSDVVNAAIPLQQHQQGNKMSKRKNRNKKLKLDQVEIKMVKSLAATDAFAKFGVNAFVNAYEKAAASGHPERRAAETGAAMSKWAEDVASILTPEQITEFRRRLMDMDIHEQPLPRALVKALGGGLRA